MHHELITANRNSNRPPTSSSSYTGGLVHDMGASPIALRLRVTVCRPHAHAP